MCCFPCTWVCLQKPISYHTRKKIQTIEKTRDEKNITKDVFIGRVHRQRLSAAHCCISAEFPYRIISFDYHTALSSLSLLLLFRPIVKKRDSETAVISPEEKREKKMLYTHPYDRHKKRIVPICHGLSARRLPKCRVERDATPMPCLVLF